MSTTPAISDKERYQQYLCSREWGVLRERVRVRCGNRCERCRFFPMSHVHHLTYIRKYRERLEDLQGLCEGCHEFTHGKRDRDPLLDVPVVLGCQQIGSVYLAGRISRPHGDWRQEIVAGWTVGNGGWCSSDADDAGQMLVDMVPLPSGRHISYAGPWWLDIWGGHGGGVGPHAFADVEYECGHGMGGETTIMDPASVATYCYDCLKASDLVFAWVDSRECWGTLLEIGWAKALKKVVVVAVPKWDRELWLACASADRFVLADSAGEAWKWLWTHPGLTCRLGAVRDTWGDEGPEEEPEEESNGCDEGGFNWAEGE